MGGLGGRIEYTVQTYIISVCGHPRTIIILWLQNGEIRKEEEKRERGGGGGVRMNDYCVNGNEKVIHLGERDRREEREEGMIIAVGRFSRGGTRDA